MASIDFHVPHLCISDFESSFNLDNNFSVCSLHMQFYYKFASTLLTIFLSILFEEPQTYSHNMTYRCSSFIHARMLLPEYYNFFYSKCSLPTKSNQFVALNSF